MASILGTDKFLESLEVMVMRCLLTAALLMAGQMAAGAEPELDEFVARSRVERASKLEAAEKRLATYTPLKGKERKEAAKAEADATEFLWKLADPAKEYYGEFRLRAGDMGAMRRRDARVFEVIDESTALVELITWGPSERRVQYAPGRYTTVGQKPRENGTLALVKGLDTSAWSDDKLIELDGFFWCSGNHTYETALGGTNTVLVVEPFDIAPHKHRFNREHELTTWRVDGNEVRGILLGYDKGVATLATMKGKLEAKLARLNEDGRQAVRDWIALQKKQ